METKSEEVLIIKEYMKITIKKVEDITGRYWAFINLENGEEFQSCYRDYFTYKEARERAIEVTKFYYGRNIKVEIK